MKKMLFFLLVSLLVVGCGEPPVRALDRSSRTPWSVNQKPPVESKTMSLGARSGRPSHAS